MWMKRLNCWPKIDDLKSSHLSLIIWLFTVGGQRERNEKEMRSFWLKEEEEKGKNVWSLLEMSENVSKEGRTSGLSLEMKLFSFYSFNIHVKKF